MKINNGGTAYPVSGRHFGYVEDGRAGIPCDTGMSLRDYFAASALTTVSHHWAEGDAKHAARVAEQCYAFADAMIAERVRNPT